ncbi:MAG: PspC domain-containing protein [Actinomycetia bacterium]|nr:PspC domain-containing protein [Actinomycetes bacterium]
MNSVETEPAQLPPPTAPLADQPPRREQRWARSDDRIILGVAGGLGRALAIDPLVVRLAFVALALFSGVGVLLYIAGALMLAESLASPPTSTLRRALGGVLALVALADLFGGSASLPGAGWVVALGLAGIAMALWRGGGYADTATAPQTDGAADSPPPGESVGADAGDQWAAPPVKQRQPPSPLGMLTIGAAAMTAAITWMANSGSDNRGTVTLSFATIVLGAGLVIGAFYGRARWLIVPAAFVATAAIAASAIAFAGAGVTLSSVDWGVYLSPGDRVEPLYETGRGSFNLFLNDYDSDLTTTIEVGVGDLTVYVPDSARVQVDARIGAGSITALDSTASGYRETLRTDSGTGTQLIKLTLRVGIGEIEVVRASAAGIAPQKPSPPGVEDGVSSRGAAMRSFDDGTVVFADGSIQFSDGQIIEANRATLIPISRQVEDGSLELANGAIIQADGTVITPGGFIVAKP